MSVPIVAPGTPLCRLDETPDMGAHEVLVGEDRGQVSVILLRQGEAVTAFRNRCPHFQIPLNARPDSFLIAGEGLVMCGFHSAVFRFSDGVCVDGPCKGARLQPIPVRRDGDMILAA